jgi:cell division protein FtsZ
MEPPAPQHVPAKEEAAPQQPTAEYDEAFVPPAASKPETQQPRMPQIEDFPLIAQKEMRAREAAEGGHGEERRRPGLFQRLASVGLGRRDDSEEAESEEHPVAEPRVVEAPVSEYAKRPQRPAHTEQPRHAPQVANAPRRPAALDDDQYEIPAFLRRQAN